jgi:hypothetical protein
MKKLYLLLLFSNFVYSNNIMLNDSVKAEIINTFNTNYKDFIIVKNSVYAITNGDSLISIDLKKKKSNFIFSNIRSIAKTSKNEIIGVNTKGEIFKFKKKIIKIIDTVKSEFQKIYLDKNDNPLVISSIGIYYLKEYHIPKNKLNVWPTIHKKNLPISIPDLAYIDKKNRLWLSYDRGEWGDDPVIFNLVTKEFQSCDYLYLEDENKADDEHHSIHNQKMLKAFPDKLKIVNDSIIFKFPYSLPIHNPIKGISENNNGEILISQSVMHFGFSGGIYLIFEEEPYFGYYDLNKIIEKEVFNNSKIDYIITEYIGTCTFNKFDKHFYYYTNKGFLKIIDKDKVFSKEFIFRPWITWNSGLALAVGYQMNVTKFEFLSKKEMVFVTANNGIGYFNGTEVVYYK